MIECYHHTGEKCSRAVAKVYSTSFYSAIRLLHKDIRQPIFNIYGFVRLADEIVDTFHAYNKATLLEEFIHDTYEAIERGISLNPVLHSFQQTVHAYGIDRELIDAFFNSMRMDLSRTGYDSEGYKEYIYGSAEVVGLMCLMVFCEGDKKLFDQLKTAARHLGAAFQKVNFLRDIKADYNNLQRVYFPGCDFSNFSEQQKLEIEQDISRDFEEAYRGVVRLPFKAKFGVYVAYRYYMSLFRKIKRSNPSTILQKRVRIPDLHKAIILLRAGVKNKLRLI